MKTLMLGMAAVMSGCTSVPGTRLASTDSTFSQEALRVLQGKRMFFGHQSVGYDIIAGVHDILAQHPSIRLKIVESADPAALDAPALAHAAVGRNTDPESKIRDFAQIVRNGIGSRADIVTFKFCYVDFGPQTDIHRTFGLYRATMTDLARAYPKTLFLCITVPLVAYGGGFRADIRTLLGRPDPSVRDNQRRSEFNELLRKEYGGHLPIFDLALAEATPASGRSGSRQADGVLVPSLLNEFTNDGGHLNETGRRVVAERFLSGLASQLKL